MVTEYGKFLRKVRIDECETLKTMSEKLGVTSAYLSAVENGKRNIPQKWFQSIHDIYNLSNEQIQEMKIAADNSVRTATIDLKSALPHQREAALVFSRSFENIDDEMAERIIKIFKNREG